MAVETKYEAFNELNNKRQKSPQPDLQLELFQMAPVASTTKSDYWFYSDLYNIFGDIIFPITPSMQFHAYNKIILPYDLDVAFEKNFPKSQTTQFYEQHINTTQRAYRLQSYTPGISDTMFHNAKDIALSRYACWCIVKNQSTFARTYFISPLIKEDITFQDLLKYSTEYQRVDIRQKVSELEKQLSGAIHSANGNFRDFYNQTTPHLFGGMTYADVKAANEIYTPDSDTLLDYMGSHTLKARFCALRRTLDTYNRHPNKSAQTLQNLLRRELLTERYKMINEKNFAPEQDISSTPIPQIASQLKKIEKQFINQYASQSIR